MRFDVRIDWTDTCLAVVVAGLVGVATGCADTTAPDSSGTDSVRSNATALTVVPEFAVEGTEQIPEALQLKRLGFSVAQITLIPDDGSESIVVDDPFRVEFDMQQGELVRQGAEFSVPEPGEYAVELRLEPTGDQEQSTFRLDGLVSPEIAEALNSDDPYQDGGNPIPDPFHPDDDETSESSEHQSWVAFEYESQKAVTYRMDRVKLAQERRVLSFALDINDWAEELIDPITRLVRARSEDDDGQTDAPQTVDVTQTLDSTGRGYQSLAGDMRVRSLRMRGSTPTP